MSISNNSNSESANSFSETSHLFIEEQEAEQCIAILAVADATDNAIGDLTNEALARFRSIADKYLECPTLLDRSLEHMVHTLAHCQQQSSPQLHRHALSAIYTLSKVRGRKTIQRFLPHAAADIQPVWYVLVWAMDQASSSPPPARDSEPATPLWESIYTLWNWLNVLSLVPFDHSILIKDGFLESFVQRATLSLSEAGPIREAAAACLASWYVRPDLENTALVDFVEQSRDFIQNYNCQSTSNQCVSFRLMGVLQVVNTILKQATTTRERLVTLFQPLWDPLLQFQSTSTSNNLLLMKLLVKWWTRMSVTQLPLRIASWRYQRGKRCLFDQTALSNHNNTSVDDQTTKREERTLFYVPDVVEHGLGQLIPALGHCSTVVRWSAAKGIGRITQRLPAICAHDVIDAVMEYFEDIDNDQYWHGACLALAELARRGLLLPSRLKDIVPRVVVAVQYDVPRGKSSVGANVRDAACYTFWAFARAYEPSVLKPYLSELSEAIVITSLFDREVNCRRAASAAFQEAVGRQGAANFPNGIAILTAADYFSLGNRKNAYLSIATYVAQFQDYQKPILRHLYSVKLFHWDIAIRELASQSLHHLTRYDPFFMSTVVLPELLIKCLDPKHLNVRHGAVLGVAETILALAETSQIPSCLSDECLANLIAVVPTIEKNRLYRGRGGEVMRSAVCRLVECLSLAKTPLSVPDQVRLLDSVDACIPHPNEAIQIRACNALECLMAQYFPVGENGPSARLQGRVVDKFITSINSSDNPGATRGYTMALGHLPVRLIAPSRQVLDSILNCLCQAARFDSIIGGEGDAETRRNAHIAITRIIKTVGIHEAQEIVSIFPSVSVDGGHVQLAISSFLLGLEDYTSDRRGDVGSWSRTAAMKGCTELILLVAASDSALNEAYGLNASTMARVIGALLKQFCEKLDTVRQIADTCLCKLLCNRAVSTIVPFRVELVEMLQIHDRESNVRINPSWVFPTAMCLASLEQPIYFTNIMDGMVMSIGDLTQSITKPASTSLVDWTKEHQSNTNLLEALASRLVYLICHGSTRVVLPSLKTMTLLLTRQSFDKVLPSNDALAREWTSALIQTEQTYRRGDMQRLLSLIDVSLALWHVLVCSNVTNELQEVQTTLLTWMCRAFLVHPFPRVRSYMAEQLYIGLLLLEQQQAQEDDNEDGFANHALNFLVQTPWTMEHLDAASVAQDISEQLVSKYC
jgi:hypothetical protein